MTTQQERPADYYKPVYRPGLRGWWRHLAGARIIGPQLTVRGLLQRDPERRRGQWRALIRRARPSSRLRQCDIERDYWKRIVHGEPRGEEYGHTL
jgi:hypothetical protein